MLTKLYLSIFRFMPVIENCPLPIYAALKTTEPGCSGCTLVN